MPAYVVGTIHVTDPACWQQYLERVGGTFGSAGGQVLMRAVKAASLHGDAHGERIVVIEFPDAESARRWHESPAYQALAPLRDAGADVVLTIYQP